MTLSFWDDTVLWKQVIEYPSIHDEARLYAPLIPRAWLLRSRKRRNSRPSLTVFQVQGQTEKTIGTCLKTETKTKEKLNFIRLAWDTVLPRVIRNYNLYSFGFVVIEGNFDYSGVGSGVGVVPGSPGSSAPFHSLASSWSRFSNLYVVNKWYRWRQFLSIEMQMIRILYHCFLPCGSQFCICGKFISDSRQSGFGWHSEFSFKLIHLPSPLNNEWALWNPLLTFTLVCQRTTTITPFEAEVDLYMTGVPIFPHGKYVEVWTLAGA